MEVKKNTSSGADPLDPLAIDAARLDRELGGQVPDELAIEDPASAPSSPAPIPLDQEVAGIFAAIAAGAGAFLPSVKTVLDDGKCRELGAALAPVLEKYGLSRYLAGFAWRVELQAALVVIPTIIALKAAVEHDLAKAKRPPEDPAGDPPPMLKPTA